MNAYLSIYPEAAHRFPSDRSGIIEDIYETYRRNGFFYHSSHRLYPAAPSTGGTGQCSLYRGVPPEKPCYMSGLGLYGVTKAAEHGQSAAEMFELQKQPFSNYLQEALANNDWNEVEWAEDAEFLRLNPPFSGGYWQKNRTRLKYPQWPVTELPISCTSFIAGLTAILSKSQLATTSFLHNGTAFQLDKRYTQCPFARALYSFPSSVSPAITLLAVAAETPHSSRTSAFMIYSCVCKNCSIFCQRRAFLSIFHRSLYHSYGWRR